VSLDGKRALVTGAAGGIGGAIVARLEAAGADVVTVDLRNADVVADVADPRSWDDVAARAGELDVACLNAGVVTGHGDLASLTDEQYRRIMGVNVDGAVYGLRALLPRLREGAHVVVTASLAGLGPMASDPIYSGTKHFLVGLVRSAAPQLAERGIRINAVCPGIADTPLLGADRERLLEAGFPLLMPDDVAEAVMRVLEDDETGQAWAVQPGREPLKYAFRGVPGPRVAGAEGMRPPL
jgi:NAD(P)-dependent dehydrogenase (short-subunit alcohol dehydrogenase family)